MSHLLANKTISPMKIPILFLVACVLLSTACSLLDSNKEPERPEIPGKIVFASDDEDGTSQIFTMNANGSDLKQLTDFEPSGEAVQPSWHPDGQQILFSSFEQGTSIGPALWVMDADGSNQRVLYDPEPQNPDVFPLLGNNARWSPDGSKVAFDLCLNCQIATNYEIYVFDTVTKSLTKLTDHPAIDTNPTWSPDGTKIAFATNRDYLNASTRRYRKDLYVINIEDSNLKRLTESGNATHPVWSPVNNTIAYEWNVQENKIYVFNTNSETIQNIETGLEFAGNPRWNNQATQLLVFGKESTQSPPSIVYLNLEEATPKILNRIILDKSFMGKKFDWFISKK